MAAPKHNTNAMSHGARRYLNTGKLPKGCSYIKRQLSRFRDDLEAEALAVGGEIRLYGNMRIQSMQTHEARAQLYTRYARQKSEEGASPDEVAKWLDKAADAREARDRAAKDLGIHVVPNASQDAWSVLYSQDDQSHQPHQQKPGGVA